MKKNLIKIIYKIEFKKSNRINIIEENANIPTTINGSNLINKDEMEKHFNMLKDAWN